MNIAAIIGNLTRDPELRTTPSGTTVCTLGVAVNDRKPDGNGGWEDYAHFFEVTVWGQQGELCGQYLSKGKKVAVTGKLEHQRWTNQEGENRSKVVIVAQPFGVTFLTPKGEGGGSNQFVPAAGNDGGALSNAFPSAADDDIPF